MTTETIGTSSRDHSTIGAWFTNTIDGLNLVTQATGDEIGECYNDSEFSEQVTFGNFTADASNKVILRAAAGESFIDHASADTNALKYSQSNGVAWTGGGSFQSTCVLNADFIELYGLQIKLSTGSNPQSAVNIKGSNRVVENCILTCSVAYTRGVLYLEDPSSGTSVVNCLLYSEVDASGDNLIRVDDGTWDLESCTVMVPDDHANSYTIFDLNSSGTTTVRNCLLFSNGGTTLAEQGSASGTGSYNGGEDTEANLPGGTGNNNQGSLTIATELEDADDTTGDYRTTTAGTADDNGSVTGLSGSQDIIETARDTPTAIGCWEPASTGQSATAGIASETDTAFAVGRAKGLNVGQAAETDIALAVVPNRDVVVGLASEIDTGFAVVPDRAVAIGIAVEVDTGLRILLPQTVVVGLPSEVDTAFGIVPNRDEPIGIATETDTAFAFTIGRAVTVGISVELDTGLALSSAKLRAIGIAVETDTAFAVATGIQVAVDLASETDVAFAIIHSKSVQVGLASEVNTAQSIVANKAVAVGQASATNTAFPIIHSKSVQLGLASEIDTAFTIIPSGGGAPTAVGSYRPTLRPRRRM